MNWQDVVECAAFGVLVVFSAVALWIFLYQPAVP